MLISQLTKVGITPEFIRFLVVGGTNTFSTYLIYLVVLWLGATPVWSYNISYAFGILISYFLNLKVTFRGRHSTKKMLLFPLVYGVQYTVGLIALKGFLYLEVPAEFAGLLIIPIVVPITFLLSRILLR